ncbi:hypothetical protein THRCLA_02913, partial [Thraustotheca clavata]
AYTYPPFFQTQNHVIFAAIFSNVKESNNISKLCEQSLYNFGSCEQGINYILRLFQNFSPLPIYTKWATQLYDIIYSLDIQWMQFTKDNSSSTITLNHTPVLNPLDSEFDFFAWQLLYHWIIGNSEVVSFQGDNGILTLLSNPLSKYEQPIDPSQLSTVFALFAQRGVEYVTFVMMAVASLTFLRGRVEGLNMFELSRVGGIVWIGRPLVLLRSLTALCLLSTASVELKYQNEINYFANVTDVWYRTCLAANELTWLVGILNDIFIIYTKEWTLKYATINSTLVWFISACFAMLLPVEPKITIQPECQVDTLDFQIECNVGDITIGSLARLIHLTLIVIFSNLLCYTVVRCFFRNSNNIVSTSLLLSGGARYLFEQKQWIVDEIYYLDTASAVLNGVLSFRYDSKWYVFDVKTWRMYKLKELQSQSQKHPKALHGYNSGYFTAVLALVWLWFSIATSIWYLLRCGPFFANNLLWPDYNSSGYQTFLVDCFNELLEAPNKSSLSLFAMEQSYSSPSITPKLHPTYPMALISVKLTSLEHAILSIRNSTPSELIWLPMNYCWVDFNRRWELAHTTKRQERCSNRYSSNGAVFMETMLRNTNWTDLIRTEQQLWDLALFDVIRQNTLGTHWLEKTSTANATVEMEVLYWSSFNISKYQLQWQDYFFPGLDETITITNAIGISVPVIVKSTPSRRNEAKAVSFSTCFGFDLWSVAVYCNVSLLRESPYYFIGRSCDGVKIESYEDLSYLANAQGKYINQTGLLHERLGPYLSSDLWIIAVPEHLASLVNGLLSKFYNGLIEDSQMATAYDLIQPLTASPTPPAWGKNYLYYGGSPLCLSGSAQSFAQTSISFDDSCLYQKPISFTLPPSSVALALLLTRKTCALDSICDLDKNPSCRTTLNIADELLSTFFLPLFNKTVAEIAVTELNVGLIQFATDLTQKNWTLLHQPLLDVSPWAFYGWAMLLDWVKGTREVIAIEGDNGSLALISEAYSTASMTLSQGSLTNASIVVYYALIYFTTVIILLGVVCTLGLYQCRHSNIFFFNRLVGSTWIGRPIMFLRGATAVVLLSSAPINLSFTRTITKFDLSHRSILDTIILSNEATWIAVVAHELILPFTSNQARQVGHISVCLTFIMCITIDTIFPVEIITQVDYHCRTVEMIIQLYCTSGTIEIGSYSRILLLLQLQCGIVLIVALVERKINSSYKIYDFEIMSISGLGRAFLLPPIDRVSGILAGILPWSHLQAFDVILWSFITLKSSQAICVHQTIHKLQKRRGTMVMKVLLGTIYVCLAIVGSISYLQMLQINLPNDLVWKNFNITGVHVFLANWFLESFPFYNTSSTFQLNDKSVNYVGLFNLTNPIIPFNGHIGANKQYTELTSIRSAIVALRKLDACEAPWLSTQYCYLDFEQKWEVANSVRRQERCKTMVSNGAVYLESVLRNVDWERWMYCWGDEFDIGFGNELRRSISGKHFLQSLDNMVPLDEEHNFWKYFNITSYILQWQNYKYLGSINTYTITSPTGASYPFVLASTRGAYRWNHQTSLKMYWTFGNDLKSILTNTTLIGGKSLLRSSSSFAFANVSLQDIYLHSTSYIPSPWQSNYAALEKSFGPFGSFDMNYIGVPRQVQEVAREFINFVREISQEDFGLYFNISDTYLLLPVPKKWMKEDVLTIGGSVLCPIQASEYETQIAWSLYPSFSYDMSCDPSTLFTSPYLFTSRNHAIFSAIFSNVGEVKNLSEVCIPVWYEQEMCEQLINSTIQLLRKHSPQFLYSSRAALLYDSVYELNIEWVQFVKENTSAHTTIYRTLILDPADTSFDFFGWQLLYDWIIGDSEVVSFQGDNGNLTLLSNTLNKYKQPVDISQLPTVFALFAQRGVQYVTIVIIAVASTAFLYIILSRGHVEGFNMLELSRIGGITWIGRPLVLLRSLTALCLLSTNTVDLKVQNGFSQFYHAPESWYKTCLAANEVTWLVGIVNDVCIIYTKEWTIKYATFNSILVWIISACLATLSPIQAKITINPHCQIDTLDFQITCNVGDVAIGSYNRLLILGGTVVLCHCLCYKVSRYLWPSSDNKTSSSPLLSGAARFLFVQEGWTVNNIYYMDTATAVLNGLLSYRYQFKWYVFDVKTWRVHILDQQYSDGDIDLKVYWSIPLHG